MSHNIEKKTAKRATLIALIGIIATIAVGVPSIYFAQRDRQTHISYDLISESNVLDIHQPLRELEVRYRGEDIHALRKNLLILRLKVANDGETHIRNADFDPAMVWGIEVSTGQIVDTPRVVEANSEYLTDNLKLRLPRNNQIAFSKIIFEKGKYFVVEMQVLHSVDQKPVLTTVGKIAGMELQEVQCPIKTTGSPSFWGSVFYGPLTVQFARFLVYLVGSALLVVLCVAGLVQLSDMLDARRDRRTLSDVETHLAPVLETKAKEDQLLTTRLFVYYRGHSLQLERAQTVLNHPDMQQYLEIAGRTSSRRWGTAGSFLLDHTDVSGLLVPPGIPDSWGFILFLMPSENPEVLVPNPKVPVIVAELLAFVKDNETPVKLHKRIHPWRLLPLLDRSHGRAYLEGLVVHSGTSQV